MHLAFIALGLTVLWWGTSYKVSLYYPPQSSVRLIPCAKLLSRNEQRAIRTAEEQERAPRPAPDFRATSLLGLLSLLLVAAARQLPALFAAQSQRESGRSWHLRQRVGMSHFFVLPPPARL